MKDEEKVVITMERHLWEDEVKARKKYRKMKTRLLILCLVLSFTSLFSGYLIGNHYIKKNIVVAEHTKLDEIDSIFRNFWYYADEYENLSDNLYERAAAGMSSFVDDPYTVYMNPQTQSEFVSDINKDYVGLGVSIREDTDADVYITKVYKNTPAYKAGLTAGDIFLEVDNESVRGIGVTEIQNRVLGEVGTSVLVKILRGNEEITFNIVREAFNSSVFGEVKDGYYYLVINSFGVTTYDDCRIYLDEMVENGLTKLILDLRSNTGGYLSAVSDIAGLFLDRTDIVLKEVSRDGTEKIQRVTGDKYPTIEKIVILQNQTTASASEVLVLALREQFKDTTVVGTNSYGKGVMQRTFALSDGSYLKITTNEWVSVNGTSINKTGVIPDVYEEEDMALTNPYYTNTDSSLKTGDNNLIVAVYQMALDFLGYRLDRTDGYFDSSFESALRRYQNNSGLSVNGELDYETERLISYDVRQNYQDDKEHFDNQYMKAMEIINEQF